MRTPRPGIWGPVLVIVAMLVLGGLVPHRGGEPTATPSQASSFTFAPSWPVFALREVGWPSPMAAWTNLVHPSWPVFVSAPPLRHFGVVVVPPTAAAPLVLAQGAVQTGRWLVACLLVMLVIAGLAWPHLRRARRRRGGVDLAFRVLTLAERGLEQRHIARDAGLPRDAVRAMLHGSAVRARD